MCALHDRCPIGSDMSAGRLFDNPVSAETGCTEFRTIAPDLADLDAFAAVARQRSFRGAAALRGVSASTLSEAVSRLEARLGLRLLHRPTRRGTPTEAGATLTRRLGPSLGG